MTEYQKGTMGKLIVQDWNVIQSYEDTPLLFILTRQQCAALIALAETLAWRTRWENGPDADTREAFTAETIFNLMNPVTCAMLNECLAPAFEAISTQLEALAEAVQDVQDVQEANAAQLAEMAQSEIENELCGGALAVVTFIDAMNRKVYTDAEESLIDNVFEAIPAILSAIPIIESLPIDELFELANAYFENQYADYQDDFTALKNDLICDLKCFVQANDNTFDVETFGEWLDFTGEQYPGNRAASVFSRYGPAAQTFINQIAELLSGEQSLKQFFDAVAVEWKAGLENPTACVACTCPEGFYQVFNDYTRLNLVSEFAFDIGVPFDVVVDDPDFAQGEAFIVWPGAYTAHYEVIAGTVEPTVAEFPWAYIEPDDDVIDGTPGDDMEDMPNDISVKGMFFNNAEATTPAFTVRITLT